MKRRNFWITIGVDALLSLGAYYSAYLVRFDGVIPPKDFQAFATTVMRVIAVKLVFLYSFKLYRGMWRYTGVHDLLNLLKALATSSGVILFGIITLYRFVGFSRGVFVIDFILSIVFLGGFRLGMRLLLSYSGDRELSNESVIRQAPAKRLLIVGAGSGGESLLREIKENRRLNYDVVGFVDDDVSKLKLTIHGVPVLGSLKDLRSVVT